jgi:uncharacterized damage-inducible protein DinB
MEDTMKEFLREMALYNRGVNAKVLEITAALSDKVISKETGVYYKSIQGTLEHITSSELVWLKRYAVFFPYPVLSENTLIKTDIAELKAKIAGGRRECAELLKETDELLVRFTEALDEKDLSKKVRYKTLYGEEFERTYWKTIFHVMNHSTHHRGEISAMLDMEKIANDFASFTLYSM